MGYDRQRRCPTPHPNTHTRNIIQCSVRVLRQLMTCIDYFPTSHNWTRRVLPTLFQCGAPCLPALEKLEQRLPGPRRRSRRRCPRLRLGSWPRSLGRGRHGRPVAWEESAGHALLGPLEAPDAPDKGRHVAQAPHVMHSLVRWRGESLSDTPERAWTRRHCLEQLAEVMVLPLEVL